MGLKIQSGRPLETSRDNGNHMDHGRLKTLWGTQLEASKDNRDYRRLQGPLRTWNTVSWTDRVPVVTIETTWGCRKMIVEMQWGRLLETCRHKREIRDHVWLQIQWVRLLETCRFVWRASCLNQNFLKMCFYKKILNITTQYPS